VSKGADPPMQDPPAVRRFTIQIQVPINDCQRAASVLATAVAQFGPSDPVHIIITPNDDTVPNAVHAGQITQMFGALEPELGPVGVITLAPRPNVAHDSVDLIVRAGFEPAEDARAILALTAMGRRFGSFNGAKLEWTRRGGFAASRAEALCNLRQCDMYRATELASDPAESMVHVVILLWSPNFCGRGGTGARSPARPPGCRGACRPARLRPDQLSSSKRPREPEVFRRPRGHCTRRGMAASSPGQHRRSGPSRRLRRIASPRALRQRLCRGRNPAGVPAIRRIQRCGPGNTRTCQPPAAESSLANVCAWRERDRNV
jgi:hypothetical protein